MLSDRLSDFLVSLIESLNFKQVQRSASLSFFIREKENSFREYNLLYSFANVFAEYHNLCRSKTCKCRFINFLINY